MKCGTRPSLTADRVPRLLNATGAEAPRNDDMSQRSNKPYSSKTLLRAWRQILDWVNDAKADPSCDLPPEGWAEVTDYVLDRIDAYRPAVAREKTRKRSPENAQFATLENRPDNGVTMGAR